ncbi:hypothetical protein [Pseudofulvibacter geojedonensis]|uniref:DNA primase n=1 Tax=Pseudofulvibacter geojedonensis TaxID=1123758 RepID=A0ABW3I285_9FLAO
MKRVIVDYKKITNELLEELVNKFPAGYGDEDIIGFKNAKGEEIEAVEIKTNDTVYLVKVGLKLTKAMENFSDDDLDIDLENDEFNDYVND